MSGQQVRRTPISAVSTSAQCLVTTTDPHEFSSGDFVRITDLNSHMPVLRGQDQINNKLFKVVVDTATTFFIKDITTDRYIDSSGYTPYVEGGSCNLDQTEFIYQS